MANINPTRMELMKQKNRLKLASHGHKLLKDKLDEMIRVFMDLLNQIQEKRKILNKEFMNFIEFFIIEKSGSYKEEIEALQLIPYKKCVISDNAVYKVGIKMTNFELNFEQRNPFNFNFLNVSSGNFKIFQNAEEILSKLINLASLEANLNILGNEIEKTRRRVNALEYRMIPNAIKNINLISNKIDENDRDALVRVIKVKDNIKDK